MKTTKYLQSAFLILLIAGCAGPANKKSLCEGVVSHAGRDYPVEIKGIRYATGKKEYYVPGKILYRPWQMSWVSASKFKSTTCNDQQ